MTRLKRNPGGRQLTSPSARSGSLLGVLTLKDKSLIHGPPPLPPHQGRLRRLPAHPQPVREREARPGPPHAPPRPCPRPAALPGPSGVCLRGELAVPG